MAIYFIDVKIIGRGKGHNIVAAAAYRAGEKLRDFEALKTHSYRDDPEADWTAAAMERHAPDVLAAAAYRSGSRLAREDERGERVVYDYSPRKSIVLSEILAPPGAPEWVYDRETLWNKSLAKDTRVDAQFAREWILALARELSFEDNRAVVHRLLAPYIEKGMVADVSFHTDQAADGGENPHCHVLLTMRELHEEGFGNKRRDWNPRFTKGDWIADKEPLKQLRKTWADELNGTLSDSGQKTRVDHRSYAARGMVNHVPEPKLGKIRHMEEANPLVQARQARIKAIRFHNRNLPARARLGAVSTRRAAPYAAAHRTLHELQAVGWNYEAQAFYRAPSREPPPLDFER